MPDLLDIIPVGDDTVFDGVFQGENTTFRLSFITDVRIFLTHTDHDGLMTWSSDHGWKDRSGSIITGEASLAHTYSMCERTSIIFTRLLTRSIVDNDSCNIFVTHDYFLRERLLRVCVFVCMSPLPRLSAKGTAVAVSRLEYIQMYRNSFSFSSVSALPSDGNVLYIDLYQIG